MTQHLSECVDSTTNIMISRPFDTFRHFLTIFFWHFFWALFCEFSGIFCKKKKSCVTCHKSHVTCHLPPVTNANCHRPSPADSSIIHSRLISNPKKALINEAIIQFWCPCRFRILRTISIPTLFYVEK